MTKPPAFLFSKSVHLSSSSSYTPPVLAENGLAMLVALLFESSVN